MIYHSSKLYSQIGMMSMNLDNIERNQLDYILTDVLPTELSNQFSYGNFYEYLLEKNNYKKIEKMINLIVKQKNKHNATLFEGSANWVTSPLKYTIMKQRGSVREISLLQPMAAVELFLFIAAYQKELLTDM